MGWPIYLTTIKTFCILLFPQENDDQTCPHVVNEPINDASTALKSKQLSVFFSHNEVDKNNPILLKLHLERCVMFAADCRRKGNHVRYMKSCRLACIYRMHGLVPSAAHWTSRALWVNPILCLIQLGQKSCFYKKVHLSLIVFCDQRTLGMQHISLSVDDKTNPISKEALNASCERLQSHFKVKYVTLCQN